MSQLSNPFVPHASNPLLIVISGLSGVGKDTVLNGLRQTGLPFHFVVTATTRPRRPTEVDGIDYLFVSRERFIEMIEKGELLEYALVYNDYKGVPKDQVRQAFASGKDVVIRVDVQGAARLKQLYPDALLIFLTVQDEQEMMTRLKNRQTETPESLHLRIATAHQELLQIPDFDYIVVNRINQLEETLATILAIIQGEHHRVKHRKISL